MIALGLIETVGYTTAVSAADAAVKAADVEIIGLEKVIGVSGYVGVTVHLSGDVAAVTSAVEAGKAKAEMVGQVISTEVIARTHSDVQEKLLSKFALNNKQDKSADQTTIKETKKTKSEKTEPKEKKSTDSLAKSDATDKKKSTKGKSTKKASTDSEKTTDSKKSNDANKA